MVLHHLLSFLKTFKIAIFAMATISVLTTACSDEMPYEINTNRLDPAFSEQEAISITAQLLHVKESRSESDCFEITPILRPSNFRSVSSQCSDTIAFIVNRMGSVGGFGVISNSPDTPKVLAFSETGYFANDSSDSPVYECFTKFLPDYIAYRESSAFNPDDIDIPLSEFKMIEPIVNWESWSQRNPYDKYVIEEHPGCPVGCVPLACVRAMVYAKDYLLMRNSHDRQELFNLGEIRQALDDHADFISSSYSGPLSDYWVQYNYNNAIDKVAKLLFYFGDLTSVDYDVDGSGVGAIVALQKMLSLGYNCTPTGYKLIPYSMSYNIIDLLQSNSLLIMTGSNEYSGLGHAWIVDGALYHAKTAPDNIPIEIVQPLTHLYLHCDWGWSGKGNGYYSGDVFEIFTTEIQNAYGSLEYMAVTKD